MPVTGWTHFVMQTKDSSPSEPRRPVFSTLRGPRLMRSAQFHGYNDRDVIPTRSASEGELPRPRLHFGL